MTYDKPKPIIQKIELSKEEQEDIDAILIGKPSAGVLKYWQKKGMDVEQRKKWYTPIQMKERMRTIYQKYKIGGCHICQALPLYKVLYKLPDITLNEYYCEKHKSQIPT